MSLRQKLFSPWSSLDNMLGKPDLFWPPEERARIQSYEKYDQMFWNDPTQYAIRVLEDEQPLYVPNARIIVETTSMYLLKGFRVVPSSGDDPGSPSSKSLENFLKRETFYSKFHINKMAGVTRGDWAFHVTADPTKPAGTRVSVDTLHPGMVYTVPDPDNPDKTLRMHVAEAYKLPNDKNDRTFVRKLTYERVLVNGRRRIQREEAIYELVPEWWGPRPKKIKQILEPELLPEQITAYPIYWLKNIDWESQEYGSSDLRGLEFLGWAASQGATDTQMALGLEGLGVYATDGGRPVDDRGVEQDWEVAPGKVMEVPSGSYFRRVEGVGSVTPMMDQLKYLESKMFAAAGVTDVAMGQVEVKVAQSGIALAIKFMPTLARIEHRDRSALDVMSQMWFDLRHWMKAYDPLHTLPQVEPKIDVSKLPSNPVELLNQLNNMLDRDVISKQYYREQVARLGFDINNAEMERQIRREKKASIKMAQEASRSSAGSSVVTDATGGNNSDVDSEENRSNNGSRPNESAGTEADQTPERQARGSGS